MQANSSTPLASLDLLRGRIDTLQNQLQMYDMEQSKIERENFHTISTQAQITKQRLEEMAEKGRQLKEQEMFDLMQKEQEKSKGDNNATTDQGTK